jgi:hypothetical protein
MGNAINAPATPSTFNATSHPPNLTERSAARTNTWREALQQLEDTRNAALSRFSFDNITTQRELCLAPPKKQRSIRVVPPRIWQKISIARSHGATPLAAAR